jgi:hypothetical protein
VVQLSFLRRRPARVSSGPAYVDVWIILKIIKLIKIHKNFKIIYIYNIRYRDIDLIRLNLINNIINN